MPAIQSTAVGVFENRGQVETAIDALRRAGFRNDQIGVVARNSEGETVATKDGTETKADEGLLAGAVAGIGVGSLVGLGVLAGVVPVIGPALVAGTLGTILTNAAGGAAIAGLTGALIGWGIPEDDARYYESEIAAGRFVMTVTADDRYEEAARILRANGARERAVSAAVRS